VPFGVRSLLLPLYERRLRRWLRDAATPRHVAVILDGNRRWAASFGAPAAHGHRAGADRVLDLLDWCEQARVEVVTLWMLSTDNLRRPEAELAPLIAIIEDLVDRLAREGRWRVRVVGALDLLPERTRQCLLGV